MSIRRRRKGYGEIPAPDGALWALGTGLSFSSSIREALFEMIYREPRVACRALFKLEEISEDERDTLIEIIGTNPMWSYHALGVQRKEGFRKFSLRERSMLITSLASTPEWSLTALYGLEESLTSGERQLLIQQISGDREIAEGALNNPELELTEEERKKLIEGKSTVH